MRTRSGRLVGLCSFVVVAACSSPPGAEPPDAAPDGRAAELDASAIVDAGALDAGRCDGVDCRALDDACHFGVCDPAAGVCVAAPRADGAACDDANACTGDDVCRGGACAGTAVADGTACDDLEACSTADACVAGVCAGAFEDATTCATATVVDLVDGVQRIEATLGCDPARAGGSCGGDGPERVYRLRLENPRRVRIEAVETGLPAVLYLRERCDDASTELACAAGSDAAPARIDAMLAAGEHVLFVDTDRPGTTGELTIEVELLEPDGCDAEPELELPGYGETTHIRGDTTGDANDFPSAGCNPSSTPDHGYRFVITERTRLRFEGVSDAYDMFLTVLAGSCEAPTPVTCNDDALPIYRPLIIHVFEPGEYHLVVEGPYTVAAGLYDVGITRLTLE